MPDSGQPYQSKGNRVEVRGYRQPRVQRSVGFEAYDVELFVNRHCFLSLLSSNKFAGDMNFTKLSGIAEQPAKADKSALIRIHLTQSSSTSVGAREVRSGGEGLDGRPRPVPCADMQGNALTPPPPGDLEDRPYISRVR